jgi:hypothetical protein
MDLNGIRGIIKQVRPSWPLPVKYIGGGANGRVFETNNGRFMKFVMNNAPQEWKSLKKLQGNFRFPRFKSGNHITMTVAKESTRERFAKMFKVNQVGQAMTIFIMGKVGGGHAMTLDDYLKKYPDANRTKIQNRVTSLIDYMHLQGISHGNLHSKNILVTADSMGRLTGMWVIDFGRSRNLPLGKTEQNVFSKLILHEKFKTYGMSGKTHGPVEVRNGSRMNRHMATAHYNRPYPRNRANAIAKRRMEIHTEMKNYKSPKRPTSAPRARSARRASPPKSPRRPRFSPSLTRKTKSLSPRRPSSKSATSSRQS